MDTKINVVAEQPIVVEWASDKRNLFPPDGNGLRAFNILEEVLFDHGMLASWFSGMFGSHWYCEIPRHLAELYSDSGDTAVRDVANKLLDFDSPYTILWDIIDGSFDPFN
jgi:hypothetical protein